MMMNCLLMIVYSLCTVRLMYTASILVCALASALAKWREKSFNFCKVKNPMGKLKQQAWQPLHEHGWKVRRF